MQVQFEVVIVGRGKVDELERTTELSVEAGGDDRTQVLVVQADHHAAVSHQLTEVLLRRTSVLCSQVSSITADHFSGPGYEIT